MDLVVEIAGQRYTLDLPRVSNGSYEEVQRRLADSLSTPGVKNRDAIAEAYLYLPESCPGSNPSDLWHHVVYRSYCEFLARRGATDPGQSWVRASGEALELVVERWYAPDLRPLGIEMTALIGRQAKAEVLQDMGLSDRVGGSKLDVVVRRHLGNGRKVTLGGVHVKASLAERVSDDVPTSERMLERGYFSPLWTLDVKSFPLPHGDLVNRGELGSPQAPSDKRKYIEVHGSFDHCYSANSRTVPSARPTASGKCIFRIDMWTRPDVFARAIIARASAAGG